jgi:DNA-binding LacI/PurR family transcriptional regulator
MAARHLLQMGHRVFAVTDEANAVGFAWDPAWTRRRHGFETAVGEAGGVISRFRLGIPRQGGNLRMQSYFKDDLPATVREWAASSSSTRPTAFFCLDPSTIQPVVEELGRHGLRVPRDMSVITVTWNQRMYSGEEPVIEGVRYTAIDFDLSTMVRRVGDALEELGSRGGGVSKSDEAQLFFAPATLRPGNSTVAPPS